MQFYYLALHQQQVGPCNLDQLKAAGITQQTMVWREGMSNWLPAGQVPELAAVFQDGNAGNTGSAPPPPNAGAGAPPPNQGQQQHQNYQQPYGMGGQAHFSGLPKSYQVYEEAFDMNTLTESQAEGYRIHNFTTNFSVGVGILLHIVTLGIFTLIQCGLMHSKLPKVQEDDFESGKAIGFCFIPYFNFYWLFVFWPRLAKRINFQYKLRSQPAPINRGLVLTTCIVMVIPYVGILAWLILLPIVYSQIQNAVNQLADMKQQNF